MTLLGRRVAVAIPDTVLEDRDSLRDKTAKLGLIARACAIYGVDLVQVFSEEGRRGEPSLVRKVLEYLETPQYLRRRLYPLDEALRYAGLLPPLRIPSHKPKVPVKDLAIGEVRDGVANEDGTVDVGLDEAAVLVERVKPGSRVTVKVTSVTPLRVERSSVAGGEYWGYKVELTTAGRVLADGRFAVTIATSRLGEPLRTSLPKLRAAVLSAESVKLVYGSPSRGLFEMLGPDLPRRSDFVVNLVADQRVATVRTEEALFAGLGLVNMLAASESLSANREPGFGKG